MYPAFVVPRDSKEEKTLHLLVKEVVGKSTAEGLKDVYCPLGKEELQLVKLGNITFTFVIPWVSAPGWSLVPLALFPAPFFAPPKKSSLLFHETQHLLSVPALQLIIFVNRRHGKPDMLQFRAYSASVYEPFP